MLFSYSIMTTQEKKQLMDALEVIKRILSDVACESAMPFKDPRRWVERKKSESGMKS